MLLAVTEGNVGDYENAQPIGCDFMRLGAPFGILIVGFAPGRQGRCPQIDGRSSEDQPQIAAHCNDDKTPGKSAHVARRQPIGARRGALSG